MRNIHPKDIDACAELFIEVFANDPWNENWLVDDAITRLSDCIEAPQFSGIAAEENGLIHGFAFGNKLRYMQERHYHLLELCVRTSMQGKGIGRMILETLADNLRKDGVSRIYTLTARDTATHRFYEKLEYYTSPKISIVVQRL